MNNLATRRDPFFALAFPSHFEDVVNRFFGEPALVGQEREGGDAPIFKLPLDVIENEAGITVQASLPGYKKDDITVEVHDGVLSIDATRTDERDEECCEGGQCAGEKGQRYHIRERRVGRVTRRITLPSTVDQGSVKADLKDGVLTLTFAKSKAHVPTKVKIG